jgi:hypothetical protein
MGVLFVKKCTLSNAVIQQVKLYSNLYSLLYSRKGWQRAMGLEPILIIITVVAGLLG